MKYIAIFENRNSSGMINYAIVPDNDANVFGGASKNDQDEISAFYEPYSRVYISSNLVL